jgi:hypothetical protein
MVEFGIYLNGIGQSWPDFQEDWLEGGRFDSRHGDEDLRSSMGRFAREVIPVVRASRP